MRLKEYKRRLREALRDGRIALALQRASESYRRNLQEALERFPHTVELAEEVRLIKERAISEIDSLLEEARRQFEKNRIKTFLARTGEEACEIIHSLCGHNRVIVKGKSLTADAHPVACHPHDPGGGLQAVVRVPGGGGSPGDIGGG